MFAITKKNVVKELLSQRFGSAVFIKKSKVLSNNGSKVMRYWYSAFDGDGSCIVKLYPVPFRELLFSRRTDNFSGPAFREYLSLNFLQQYCSHTWVVPEYYGGDFTRKIFVIEDFGDRPRLSDILLGNDRPMAEAALLAVARSLGKVHATTLGKVEVYKEMVKQAIGSDLPTREPGRNAISDRIKELLAISNIEVGSGLRDELRYLDDIAQEIEKYPSFIHMDICPDNCFMIGDEAKFIDFETGTFGFCLVDLVVFRLNFSRCWCSNRIPEEIVGKMERVYRAELVEKMPQFSDDLFYERAFITSCAIVLIYRIWSEEAFSRKVMNGLASNRQRIVYALKSFSEVIKQFNQMKHLGECMQALSDRLNELWKCEELPYYRVFQSSDANQEML